MPVLPSPPPHLQHSVAPLKEKRLFQPRPSRYNTVYSTLEWVFAKNGDSRKEQYMKQVVLLLVAVAIGVGTWFYFQGESGEELTFELDKNKLESASQSSQSDNGTTGGNTVTTSMEGLAPTKDEEDFEEYDDRPAAEIYKTLDEALEAVKKGAADYDDIILEQFVEPGEDCGFCPQFYKDVTALMKDPNASEDEKAYYSELLAISARLENIETLVDSIRSANDEDSADIYAESLELTIGNDDIVSYLSGFLEDDNELLQESAVAAVTNQGSVLAAKTLYEHTVDLKDPDGYYEIGIGLGELIPDEGTLPYLQELTLKRDDYSHLAVKSLLNYGYDGLVIVFEALANSDDSEFDQKMLTDAIDHVGYEEETEQYVKDILAKNPPKVVKDFAQDIVDGFKLDAELDAEFDEELDEGQG